VSEEIPYKRVRKWRAAGDSPEAVARRLGVSYVKLLVLLEEDEELASAFFGGRESLDLQRREEVEDALFKRAIGYEGTKHVRVERLDEETGMMVMEDEKRETFTIAPDPAAQKFYLTNVAPEKWQNRQGQQTVRHEIVHISDDILELPPSAVVDEVDAELVD